MVQATKEKRFEDLDPDAEDLSVLRRFWAKYASPAIDGASSLLTVLGFFALIASLGVSIALGEPAVILLGIVAAVGTVFYQHYKSQQDIALKEEHDKMLKDSADAQEERLGLRDDMVRLEAQVQGLTETVATLLETLESKEVISESFINQLPLTKASEGDAVSLRTPDIEAMAKSMDTLTH